jgi:hypothetical protein
MRKRFLALILLALCLGFVTGCGGPSGPATASSRPLLKG